MPARPRPLRAPRVAAAAAVAALLLAGCGGSKNPSDEPATSGPKMMTNEQMDQLQRVMEQAVTTTVAPTSTTTAP